MHEGSCAEQSVVSHWGSKEDKEKNTKKKKKKKEDDEG